MIIKEFGIGKTSKLRLDYQQNVCCQCQRKIKAACFCLQIFFQIVHYVVGLYNSIDTIFKKTYFFQFFLAEKSHYQLFHVTFPFIYSMFSYDSFILQYLCIADQIFVINSFLFLSYTPTNPNSMRQLVRHECILESRTMN